MEPKQRIGDYEVIEQLGRGGMGSVYRVRSLISDRVEAMKVLLPDLVGRQDLAARFEREIKVLAALDHPNIAQLRTALKLDNQLVMIMELVGGQSLAERVKQGPIPTSEALAYIDQVLDALTYAHAQGVIHRDIKPANMMLTPEGVMKLTDFGVALSRKLRGLDRDRHDDGLAGVHVAGADQRRRGRCALGPLLSRYIALRNGDGPASLQGKQRLRHDVGAVERATQTADRAPVRPESSVERDHSQGARQEPD